METEKTPEVRPAGPGPAAAPLPQAPASRRGPDRKTLARAGGFEAQSALLRPDADPEDRGAPAGGTPPKAAEESLPRKAEVLALEAKVMSRPQFLGTAVAVLRRGAEVTLIQREGSSWYRCRTPDGRQGFIHANRVDRKEIRLRSGDTGSGTVRGNHPDEPDVNAGRG